MVLLFGILLSISAAFEIQLKSNFGENLCKAQVDENATIPLERRGDNEMPLSSLKRNDSSNEFNENKTMLLRRLERSLDNDVLGNFTDEDESAKLHHKTSHNPADVDHYVNDVQRDNMTSTVVPGQNHNTCSSVSDFYCHPLERILVIVGRGKCRRKKSVTHDNKSLRSPWNLSDS